MRALVTGATGFIGGHIVDRLLAAGHQVRGLARNAQKAARLKTLGVEVVVGDVTEMEPLRAAAQGVDTVFHAAAKVTDWGPWAEFEAATVRGTENTLQAAVDGGVRRFLHVSTVGVYDEKAVANATGRIGEDTSLTSGTDISFGFYAKSKMLAEKAAFRYHREGKLVVSAVRPAWVYGPRDESIFPRMVQFLKSPLASWVGNFDPAIGLIYVSDVADLAIAAATSEAAGGQAYNAAPEEDVRLREFITAICRALDIPPPRRSIPYGLAAALTTVVEGWARLTRSKEPPTLTRAALAVQTRDQRFDISKAKGDLGWQPKVSMAEGVRATAAWARERELVGVGASA